MVEIEIESQKNQSLHFRPLSRTIRGRFDVNRIADPQGRLLVTQWPQPIPGQHLSIDPEKSIAYLTEPLHDAEHTDTRERIERHGMRLPPASEKFTGIDITTWMYWMWRAVQSGAARLVSGKFPDGIETAKAKKDFIVTTMPDKRDDLISKLVSLLVANLPADQRREMAGLLKG